MREHLDNRVVRLNTHDTLAEFQVYFNILNYHIGFKAERFLNETHVLIKIWNGSGYHNHFYFKFWIVTMYMCSYLANKKVY